MKPRLTYAEFVAAQEERTREWTIAVILDRYIKEMAELGRPCGASQAYTYGLLKRMPIGSVVALDLRKAHVIAHCQARKAEGVLPQTVQQDVTYLTVALKYAGSAWDDCDGVSAAAVDAAKPFLAKHNFIAKSQPRKRRPAPEEFDRLIAYFTLPPKKRNEKLIDMVKVERWQKASSRRISESCRMRWCDWNKAEQTMVVYRMKDSKNRNKTKVVALTEEAQALLVEWEAQRTDSNAEARILPFNPKSCGAKHRLACRALGIVDLRLHDSRRDCGTRLVEDFGYSPSEAILVTGHDNTTVFERNYMAMKPENFKLGPVARRLAAAQS